jgi:hypothetical protein
MQHLVMLCRINSLSLNPKRGALWTEDDALDIGEAAAAVGTDMGVLSSFE